MDPGLNATLQRQTPAGDSTTHRAEQVAAAGALCVAAVVVSLAAGLVHRDASGSWQMLLVTAVPALLAPLFAASAAGLERVLSCLPGWACSTALLASLSWLSAGRLPLDRLPGPLLVALGIVLVTGLARLVLARALAAAGAAATAADESARWLATALLWLLAAAPLWLGPLADLAAHNGPATPEAVVAMSPLVHLAVAAGQDLLRSQWLYAHSSLGSLQFDYPSVTAIAAGYAATAGVLALLAFILSRRMTTHLPVPSAQPT